jgi:hypothetical protein
MGKLQIPKKIRIEDFDAKYKDIIEKISFIFNPFSDEVYQTLNGNVDITNLNRQITVIDISIDSTGKPINPGQIKITGTGRVNGVIVINAVNTTNPEIYPTTMPFISYSFNAQSLSILNVSGLQNNSQYRLTLEIL